MDLEDISFLRDLAEELPKISSDYKAEAIELENIIHRELTSSLYLYINYPIKEEA